MAATQTLPPLARRESPPLIRPGAATRLLSAALLLGWGVEVLFDGHLLGLSVPLFVGALLGTLGILSRRAGLRPSWQAVALTVPLLGVAAFVAVRANGVLTLLNVLAGLVLLGLLADRWGGARPSPLGLLAYPFALLRTLGHALVLPAPLLPAAVDGRGARGGWPWLWPVLRGLLLALPVLGVFTLLLASADLVFAHLLAGLFRLDFLLRLPELGWRAAVVLTAAWGIAGGLAYTLTRRDPGAGPDALETELAALPRLIGIGLVEAATVLVLVDALFLAFGWLQWTYLFGGQANITAAGYTYADYARRGFFELLLVAVLTLGLIVGLHALTRRQTRRQAWVFQALSTLLIGLVLVLIAAALQRMLLYEEAYGYTELRLYVHVFLLWLAGVFGWFALTLWTRPGWFASGCVVAALGCLLTLNAINPDATIAGQNLARYTQTGKLDARYLTHLSVDAVPVLLPALTQVQGEQREILRAHLARQLQELDGGPSSTDWRTWNLARADAHALLTAQRTDLAGADLSLLSGRDDFDWIPSPDGEPLPVLPGQTVP
jgi:hypothetical protein